MLNGARDEGVRAGGAVRPGGPPVRFIFRTGRGAVSAGPRALLPSASRGRPAPVAARGGKYDATLIWSATESHGRRPRPPRLGRHAGGIPRAGSCLGVP